MVRVAIVGVPGCGKTTVLNALAERGVETYRERVDEWADWLDAYYKDKNRHAFGFQVRVLMDFASLDAETAGESLARKLFVFERSPEDSKAVFGEVCRPFMEPFEWKLYEEIHAANAWKPDLVIYMHLSPTKAWERVRFRDRASERNMSEAYVKHLYDHYESFYRNHPRRVAVDASKPIDDVVNDVIRILTTHGFM